ncbi:MAG: HlyC/CorC family transporter [Bacilli bacterium]|nr:HlyC/CorC family transporter [Bacilli bacterium]
MDDPLSWISLIAILLFLFASGFFSASETAFSALNKYRYKVLAEEGDRTARRIISLYNRFDFTLITILVGNNIVNLAMSTLSTVLFLSLLNQIIGEDLISLLVSIGMTVLVYLFGESIPKMFAKRAPDRFARFAVYPILFFLALFFPVSIILYGFSALFRLIFRTKNPPELTQEDFANVIDDSERKGIFEENESDIIQASLDFADTSVKEVLTPRSRMFMINYEGLTREKLLDILRKTSYSRIPVYLGSKDRVIGILIVKNYLNAYFANPNISLLSTLQKPYFVSPRVMIDDLIEGLRDHKTQLALVRNKEQKLIGMVTTEDVLEELVGRIDEETPELEEKEENR